VQYVQFFQYTDKRNKYKRLLWFQCAWSWWYLHSHNADKLMFDKDRRYDFDSINTTNLKTPKTDGQYTNLKENPISYHKFKTNVINMISNAANIYWNQSFQKTIPGVSARHYHNDFLTDFYGSLKAIWIISIVGKRVFLRCKVECLQKFFYDIK
jgi:hypothetical protein